MLNNMLLLENGGCTLRKRLWGLNAEKRILIHQINNVKISKS